MLGPPARGEVVSVAHTAGPGREKIGIEGEHHVGSIEAILRVGVLAERELCADAGVLAARGIPLVPLRLRQPLEQIADLPRERRRADRLGEDSESCALRSLLRRYDGADRAEKCRPRPDVA